MDALLKNSFLSQKYKFGEKIGQGGEAHVYEAQRNENDYAVRVITDEHKSTYSLLQMCRELLLLNHTSHPNIITMSDFDHYRDKNGCVRQIYIVMPKMEIPLSRLACQPEWNNNPSKNFILRKFMVQLLSGVDYLHTNGIIHRDLSMNNVMINGDLTLKIIDFGLSRECRRSTLMTNNQTALNFRPWEYISDNFFYDYKVDIWAVGCIFAQLITGTPLCQFSQAELRNLSTQIPTLIQKILSVAELPQNFNCQQFLKKHLKTHIYQIRQSEIIRHTLDERYSADKFPALGEGDIREHHNAAEGLKLLKSLLQLMPESRCTAKQALEFSYLKYLPDIADPMTHCKTIDPEAMETLKNINNAGRSMLSYVLDIQIQAIDAKFGGSFDDSDSDVSMGEIVEHL